MCICHSEMILLGLKFAYYVCSQSYRNITVRDVILLNSAGYPHDILPGVVCKWHFNSQSDVWYKILAVTQNITSACNRVLTVNQINVCWNDSLTVYNSSIQILHQNRQEMKSYNISVEVVPALRPPQNISILSSNNAFHISWDLHSTDFSDFKVVVSYFVYPFNGTWTDMNLESNITGHMVDTSNNRGSKYGITLFLRSQYGESTHTDIIDARSACVNNVSLKPQESFVLESKNNVQDTLCQWNIDVVSNIFWLKISTNHNDCTDSILVIANRTLTCKQSKYLSWIEQTAKIRISYRTDTAIDGTGISFIVSIVDKPTNPPDDINVITRGSAIVLSWKRPNDRPEVIQHYIVSYQIGSNSADHMMRTNPNQTFVNIDTAESRGQIFALKIASETNGGVGHFSKANFIRAACGVTKFILQRQSQIIIFPGHSQATYLPNVQCTWTFNTSASLWFKINIDTLNLEHSDGCRKDYLQVGNSTFCGRLYNKEIVHRSNTVKIMFVSDGYIGGIGFILSVSAVGTPPDKPRNISIKPGTYGLMVTWERPLYKTDFIESYSLFYEHEYTSEPVKMLLSKHQFSYVIDTTKYPGARFEVWISSNGDGGCGGNINISNTSSFIITPFYGNWRPRDAFCKWHVTSQFSFLLQIMDVKLPQSNSSSCDHVTGQCGHLTNKCDRITLEISNYGKICDQQEVLKTYHIHEKEADFSLTARNNKDDIKLFLRISTSELMDTTFPSRTKQPVSMSGCSQYILKTFVLFTIVICHISTTD
ncbi:unnamed protein product [Mytilus edulis]|uniref:Cubilin n=1 Tax=Mytilus edulis TaxID=6550 RepID=A0A8S3TV48_MYTED|nr:unnamed protein product [Mytilus edulis]